MLKNAILPLKTPFSGTLKMNNQYLTVARSQARYKPPPRANSPPTESFIIYDERSSPGADDYIIDADRTTLRLSTGYPTDSWTN